MPHQLLESAAVDLATAEILARWQDAYEQRVKTIKLPPAHPYLEPLRVRAQKALDDAAGKARTQDYPGAMSDLVLAEYEVNEMTPLVAPVNEYAAVLKELQKTVSKTPDVVALREEAAKLTKEVEEANKEWEKHTLAGLKEGTELLNKALEHACLVKAQAQMLNHDDLDKEVIKKLAATPEGAKALDKMVASLGTEQLRMDNMAALLEARFNISEVAVFAEGKKEDADTRTGNRRAEDLSLRKIYELMAKVPSSHTKDNPSLAKVKRYTGDLRVEGDKARDKGSYYSPRNKEVVISANRPEIDFDRNYANPEELEPEALKYLEAEGAKPKNFPWCTLHEVAHAVDDKKGFMKKNGPSATYGGWAEHGGDVMPAAKAAAAHFKYDIVYIAKLLSDETPNPVPPAPENRTDWDACRLKAEGWAATARVGQNPWKKTSSVAALTLPTDAGDRVFHEAYGGSWVSYSADARKVAVSGYQFRAPGEWFSEVYACYGLKKLKSSHPAYSWLQKLFKDK